MGNEKEVVKKIAMFENSGWISLLKSTTAKKLNVDQSEVDDVPQNLSPAPEFLPNWILPPGWEKRESREGRFYYVDHNTRSTSWNHPSTHRLEVLPAMDDETQDESGDESIFR